MAKQPATADKSERTNEKQQKKTNVKGRWKLDPDAALNVQERTKTYEKQAKRRRKKQTFAGRSGTLEAGRNLTNLNVQGRSIEDGQKEDNRQTDLDLVLN